jgi:hypothetical protein
VTKVTAKITVHRNDILIPSLFRTAIGMVMLAAAVTTMAHPFGGNGANRQAVITVAAGEVQLRYLLHMAEVPTALAAQEADADHDGKVSDSEWNAYAGQWAQQLASRLHLSIGDEDVRWRPSNPHWSLQSDIYGLSTSLRLEVDMKGKLRHASGLTLLRYRDDYRPDEKGWREVMLTGGSGATVHRSTVASHDRSRGLTEVYVADARKLPDESSAYAEIEFVASPAHRSAEQAAAKINPARADVRNIVSNEGAEGAEGGVARPAAVITSSGLASPNALSPPLKQSTNAYAQLQRFFLLGMHHIATGWDHLLFLFGLLLLSQSLPHIARMVTAFTIAHSITLLYAASGLGSPPDFYVEPAIALTIAYVGFAALLARRSAHGAWLAFGFGLVHGFGFAGALAESLASGALPRDHWLLSIAGFNLGIEIFQLLLVCAVVPLLRVVARQPWARKAHESCAIFLLGTGLSVFVVRLSAF